MSDSLWHHGLQHAKLSCPSVFPGVCANSYPSNWWCHPTISSSFAPFSPCPHSFPALESFPRSWLFPSGGKNSGASASATVLPMNIQSWFPLGFIGLISFSIDWFDFLEVQGTLENLLQYHSSKASILWHSVFLMVQLILPYMTTGKTIALTIWTFVGKLSNVSAF